MLQRRAEEHLLWLFVQPCTGRWNFFPDAAGICLTPCSVCGGGFGSGLAQCRTGYYKETGMADFTCLEL